MLGAQQSLQRDIPGIFVDAKVSRQFWDATIVLQAYKNEGLLPPTVIIHMGTNGAFSDSQFAQMMAVLGKRTVFFVDAKEPRPWEAEVNQRLANRREACQERALDRLARLRRRARNWFVADGIHLTGVGRAGLRGAHPLNI